jgi:hypothetical protein
MARFVKSIWAAKKCLMAGFKVYRAEKRLWHEHDSYEYSQIGYIDGFVIDANRSELDSMGVMSSACSRIELGSYTDVQLGECIVTTCDVCGGVVSRGNASTMNMLYCICSACANAGWDADETNLTDYYSWTTHLNKELKTLFLYNC